jgi:hypothetical protein
VLVVAAVDPSSNPGRYSYSATLVPPIDLFLTKDAADPTGTVRLDWVTANPGPFAVFRGGDAATLWTSPNRVFAGITGTFLVDGSAPGPLDFYSVIQE